MGQRRSYQLVISFFFLIVETTTDYVGGAKKALVMNRAKTPFGVK